MGFRKIFLSAPSTNQLGNFLRFWQSNLKNSLNFSKVLLLTLNKGCHLAGCFSKFPAKIFLPSLTLNKGRRLWGCFREQFEILSKKGFSAQISKLSGETFHF